MASKQWRMFSNSNFRTIDLLKIISIALFFSY
jgi:hypothetical protein